MRDGSSTRKRLERCALTLFVKKGINATTIKDIANSAGIAEGTLYRHYKSKEELALSLFVNAYEETSLQFKKLSEKYATVEEKIKAMIHFFCEKYDEDPILFNYLLLAQHHQLKNINENEISAQALLVPMFSEAIAKKEVLKRDPNFYAAILLGIVLQAAVSRVYGRITRSMKEDAQDLVEVTLGALKH